MTDARGDLDSTIAFVLLCLFEGAIDDEELRGWADHVIATMPAPPSWLVDVAEFRESLPHIYEIIGRVPDREFDDAERNAVIGIALQRGRTVADIPCTPEVAAAALTALPAVRDEFARTFPFLSDK